MSQQNQTLSNLQIELLKLYANNISENTLSDIKQILSTYFSTKLSSDMDRFIEQNNISSKDLESWANEHR